MREWRIVILSARAENLVPCVHALLQREPELHPEHIIVVDDGARSGAELRLPRVTWVAGEKPFVFARNANIGLRAAGSADVLLLNDDARLVTPGGISRMSSLMAERTDIGLCSAAIQGVIGNPRQLPAATGSIRLEPLTLAFVAVFIPRNVYQRLGPLDERFVGYGWEDNDYCARARAAGLACGVADVCVVDHSGELPSTFRTRRDLREQYEINRQLYETKATMKDERTTPVDVMFLACNRLEFTRETFGALLTNTDWSLVNELHVYDDGSVDGTREWLAERLPDMPCRTRLVDTRWGSPVTAMGQFIESATAPMLAKVDNDAMMPPGWLRESLEVFARRPHLDLLGIEAMYPVDAQSGVPRSFAPALFVGGLGLYRRRVFHASRPKAYAKWSGLQEWQHAQGPGLVRGWITPALPVFLLDRCPFEPWRSLTDEYVRRGWQRAWDRYPTDGRLWHWRWPPGTLASTSSPTGFRGFVGAMRIRNEAAHISEVLTRALALCERVFVFDDHSTDGTAEICGAFGDRVLALSSPFAGLDEARDKNYLLKHVIAAGPRWVLWIDGDEVLERSGAERLAQAAANAGRVAAFSLRIAYVWDDLEHVRVDGIYGSFSRPSLFRLESQPVHRLSFRATGKGCNFHCGNVPDGLIGTISRLEVRLKHLGYVTAQQRRRKYEWYTALDPDNSGEDYYRHLIDLPGARFASATPQIVPWTE